MWKNTTTWILNALQKQGLSFVLLGLIAYGLYLKVEDLQTKVDQCNAQTIEMYKQQNERLIDAFENLSFYLKDKIE